MSDKVNEFAKNGINRNIVECKAKCTQNVVRFKLVLIETLWNVEFNSAGGYWNIYYRINRNIVECKVRPSVTIVVDMMY